MILENPKKMLENVGVYPGSNFPGNTPLFAGVEKKTPLSPVNF